MPLAPPRTKAHLPAAAEQTNPQTTAAAETDAVSAVLSEMTADH